MKSAQKTAGNFGVLTIKVVLYPQIHMAYMLRYDTMHGQFDGTIEYTDDAPTKHPIQRLTIAPNPKYVILNIEFNIQNNAVPKIILTIPNIISIINSITFNYPPNIIYLHLIYLVIALSNLLCIPSLYTFLLKFYFYSYLLCIFLYIH